MNPKFVESFKKFFKKFNGTYQDCITLMKELNHEDDINSLELCNKAWEDFTHTVNTPIFKFFKSNLIEAFPNNSYYLNKLQHFSHIKNKFIFQIDNNKLAIVSKNANFFEEEKYCSQSLQVFQFEGPNNIVVTTQELIRVCQGERANTLSHLNDLFPEPLHIMVDNREGVLYYNKIRKSFLSRVDSLNSIEDQLMKITHQLAEKCLADPNFSKPNFISSMSDFSVDHTDIILQSLEIAKNLFS